MTRRVRTLLTGLIVLGALLLAMIAIPIPYVALVPGPTVDTLGTYNDERVIVVEGTTVNETEGHLNLTTVGVVGRMTLVEAIYGWFSPNTAVVPRESVYPPTETREETEQKNREDYLVSESSAIAAAYHYLGYPVMVVVVTPPQDSAIRAGDAIVKVNGMSVRSFDELGTLMEQIPPNTPVKVDYLHFGEMKTATITTTSPGDDRTGSLLGVTVTERGYSGFNVSFSENDIGGPSAGLMLSLGIIHLVGREPLIDDEFIAGTGTIDVDGDVGPIGGVRFKIEKAAEVGAQLFLVPSDNCAEALVGVPNDAPLLAKVDTLQDATMAIADLRAGDTPVLCE